MSINLKDLKKFPGNKALGGQFMLLPVDTRKYTVKDVPKLPANRVQVRAIIPLISSGLPSDCWFNLSS